MKLYYDTKLLYTNRTKINLSSDLSFLELDYINIDSPDTINGHIIYNTKTDTGLIFAQKLPTYIVEDNGRRWFVSGITQLNSFKFQLSLIRDIISESNNWQYLPAYIEAGLATNHLKYKIWGLPYTNTKIAERRIDINGKSSFFVFYVNTQNFENNTITEQDLQISTTTLPGYQGDYEEITDVNEIPFSEYMGTTKYRAAIYNGSMFYKGLYSYIQPANQDGYVRINLNIESESSLINGNVLNATSAIAVERESDEPYFNCEDSLVSFKMNYFYDNNYSCRVNFGELILSTIESYIQGVYGVNHLTKTQYDSLEDLVGKVYYNTTNNKAYIIKKTVDTTTTLSGNISKNVYYNNMDQRIQQNCQGVFNQVVDVGIESNGDYISINSTMYQVKYEIVELGTATKFDFNFKANVKKLPSSAVRCVNLVAEDLSDEELSSILMLAQTNGINEDNQVGRILDIQFLPFSVARTTNDNFTINDVSIKATFIETEDLSYISHVSLSEFNFHKEYDTINIVSPSRASQYQFRPSQVNHPGIFYTKITLKPYATSIYIKPNQLGLLTTQFDDKDCLIIQEDFSLTNVSSEWTNYIYNNKNYSSIFERDMQGREFQRSWERRIEKANMYAESYNARNLNSQLAKAYTGNIPIISDIAGAIGAGIQNTQYLEAAKLDRQMNEAIYQQSVDQARDQFNYQLDNLKSQPAIPSKITTIDIKLLDGVYIEIWSTNESEKESIDLYYQHNGHRIDSYGRFDEYLGSFVRGKILLSDKYSQPELNELNRRLATGIYLEGGIYGI